LTLILILILILTLTSRANVTRATPGDVMKVTLITLICLLPLTSAPAQQKQTAAKSSQATLEADVRKVWEDFKNKNKESLGAALADSFRVVEEGTSGIADKKADLATVDELELISYTLKNFIVQPLGPRSALVTYSAHYESKSGGQTAKADSVFGEVWIRQGNDWKALYVQETYVQNSTAK
jgi:hypothetical protein